VLDLEALAHRNSVLGMIPTSSRRKALRHAGVGPLRRFDPARPVLKRKRKVGNLACPTPDRADAGSPCLLELPDDERALCWKTTISS
jgi:hypothetical protein